MEAVVAGHLAAVVVVTQPDQLAADLSDQPMDLVVPLFCGVVVEANNKSINREAAEGLITRSCL